MFVLFFLFQSVYFLCFWQQIVTWIVLDPVGSSYLGRKGDGKKLPKKVINGNGPLSPVHFLLKNVDIPATANC